MWAWKDFCVYVWAIKKCRNSDKMWVPKSEKASRLACENACQKICKMVAREGCAFGGKMVRFQHIKAKAEKWEKLQDLWWPSMKQNSDGDETKFFMILK